MKYIYYTGIGSRNCPENTIEIMIKTATWLAKKGYVLRSGKAKGSDEAFEKGCDIAKGKKEIYLPWKNFNGSNSTLIVKDIKAFEIARKYHPYFDSLSQGAQRLQARNSHQVLGQDLNTLSKFILCYTPNGDGSGGTGQAIRIAKDYNIPIFDFGKYKDINECRANFKEFMAEIEKN